MESETACLILNTFDINSSSTATVYWNATIDNQYGTITNNRCNLTWKNINMRQVLGEMYDKYETFNLYLYQINQSNGFGSAATTTVSQQLVDIRIKGLQFLNNGYNVISRNNTNSAYLTSYILNITTNATTALGTVTPMFNPTILTFGKSAEYVDINIDMKCTRDQQYPAVTANTMAFGTFILCLKYMEYLEKNQIKLQMVVECNKIIISA